MGYPLVYLHFWESLVLSNSKMMVLNNSMVVVLVVSIIHLLVSTIAHISTLYVVVHVAASVTFTTLLASSFALAIDNLEQPCMTSFIVMHPQFKRLLVV